MENCHADENDTLINDVHCNAVWDSIMCWPPTKSNSTVQQLCPPIKGHDPTKYATRFCSAEGKWIVGTNNSKLTAWTDYSECFTPEVLSFLIKLLAGDPREAQKKLQIAENTRIVELIGLSSSIFFLLISIFIFRKFTRLSNSRTKIHLNLFASMFVQAAIRLLVYLDQVVTDNLDILPLSFPSINDTPILCKISYSLMEYAKTVMFMWMFTEGFYLYNSVAGAVLKNSFNYVTYISVGWGIPLLNTLLWVIVMSFTYQRNNCWYGYSLTWYFWILEGPRLFMILVNLLFLLRIMQVLLVKLSESSYTETEQIRKAVKAALLLLPLLGVPNLLFLIEAPIDKSATLFMLWSYLLYFFSSFQGMLVSFLYCFLNAEVKTVIMNKIRLYVTFRNSQHRDVG